jgi:NAD(P)-dependent dehydrogenase (short-subunit alcohol dehydrogenase family)
MAQGAKVVITGRSQKAVEEAEKALTLGATGIVANQSNLTDLSELADEVKKQFGHVDILVINVGIMHMLPIERVIEAHFDEIMDINFKGAFLLCRSFYLSQEMVLGNLYFSAQCCPGNAKYASIQCQQSSPKKICTLRKSVVYLLKLVHSQD